MELAIKDISYQSNSDLLQPHGTSWFDFNGSSRIHIYLPPEDLETRSFSTGKLGTSQKSPFSALEVLLQRFIFLSTNNLLDQRKFNQVCNWIAGKCGADILVFLCQLKSISMEVFASKVLYSAIESGNTYLASRVLQCRAHLQEDPSQSQRFAEYLSEAVHNGHEAMVELLCKALSKAGVPPKVKHRWTWLYEWGSSLPILHTLLDFGADPESFGTEKPGLPLINAAFNGNLQAVKLLLDAGARVDLYLPSYRGTALQAAASRGHLEVAKYLMESGADVDSPGVLFFHLHNLFRTNPTEDEMISVQTPIQIATKMNNLDLLQILLQHEASATACPVSANPDFDKICDRQAMSFKCERLRGYKPQYWGPRSVYTALQYAVLNQNLDMVALLLSEGVAPDSRVAPGVGDTPLQMSARLSNFELFQLLLFHGADVNAPPAAFNGRTAMQAAAECGNWEILSMLHSEGARINAPAGAELGMTALQAACLNGHSLMAGFLLAHQANLNAAPSPMAGLTPLQAAATHGDVGLVSDLISLGAESNAPATEMGTTALVAAIENQSLPLLKTLVQHGTNVNPTGDYKLSSPLREAVAWDWLEGVKFLLEHGANANDTPFEVATSGEYAESGSELLSPLGAAITNESEGMIELLLQYGADVLATAIPSRNNSSSALICALQSGRSLHIIYMLLAKVQELEKHPGWEDALKFALEGPDDIGIDSSRLIIEKLSPLPLPLRHNAIQRGWDALNLFCFEVGKENMLEVITILLQLGAELDRRAEDGTTLLQRIAGIECSKSCRFLVSHGAAVNTHASRRYGTPLQEAIRNKNVRTANLLLDHGADVNALPAERWGVTALQAASINGMLRMALRLLECGADVSAPAAQEEGRTAIDGAAERGNRDMVQLLLNAYREQEGLRPICNQAAGYAEKEGHYEIARWLRGYSPV